MNKITSRNQEVRLLEKLLKSKKPELVPVYGRRRIGKTFLIREFFKSRTHFFMVSGLMRGNLSQQLEVFRDSWDKFVGNEEATAIPDSWYAAFQKVTRWIEKTKGQKPIVIFLDELPWLATKKSGLLDALEHFWNQDWSLDSRVKLIVCGSAASWMLDNIINAKGGLHNRMTARLHLKPFDLKQSHEFVVAHGLNLSKMQMLDFYMIFGGVPFYLEQLKKSASVAQNINQLCFSRDGLLNDEFDRLFKSLFEYAQEHMALIRMIAQKHGGVGRSELTKKGFSSGGQLSKRLGELEAAGFIQSFYPFGQRKEIFYKVCDPFSLFYLKWIDPIKSTGKHFVKQHLQSILNTPKWHNWTGYAFENVCFMHADELIEALGLDGICTSYSDYVIRGDVEYQGAQIDLLLERNDGAVTLCEMKYSHAQFSLDKKTAVPLMNKVKVLSQKLGSEIQIFIVLVTPKGLKKTIWVEELVDEVLTLEDF